ncbi:3-mercaptopyruvate sulfurtransferase [Phenylobacterium sp.]|uniref:3-mercaptopyruvate sulfurtransferase n=1 Tax=Phenylobacterium sp. TaxID=1871053 RepID=UPI0025ECD03C|nr:3-mercaptopyruvate sulfurtransferase [Phenylobacterium sp.]MCA3739404.1 3-mercaptopyruvate sulfurtransferase [Phenylobacterium sp.]
MSPSPLITVAELASRLEDPDLRIIDASWFLPAEGRSGRDEFNRERIPRAVFFDIDAISDTSVDLPHMLPSPAAFADSAKTLGLTPDVDIVVYDSFGIRSAARVWWTLRVMGMERVRVLDGGLRVWKAAGLPLETLAPNPPRQGIAAVRFDPARLRDRKDVAAALAKGSAQVVDARSALRFRGEAPEPRPGLRSGHMPGARNLPFDQLLTPEGQLKSVAALSEVFREAGVDLARPIIATCGSGVTASVLALALEVLGSPAAVYDGSWAEWGREGGGDIATGGA